MSVNITKALTESIEFLKEEEELEVSSENKSEPHKASVDGQIDKHFIEFEREAREIPEEEEGRTLESFSRTSDYVYDFLREADEEEEDPAAELEEPAAEEPEESDELEIEKRKLNSDDIDMLSFVGDIVRLIENFDKLVEIRDTVVHRAMNFLLKDYDEDTVEQFRDILNEEYGISPGKTRYEREYEIQAPKAGAAGPYGS